MEQLAHAARREHAALVIIGRDEAHGLIEIHARVDDDDRYPLAHGA